MYHLSPCIVALPNKRVQSDAAAAARISARNWLCNVLRVEGHFGKIAARLTRRALASAVSIGTYIVRNENRQWHKSSN
jgi:hypothetical protein